MRLQCEVDVLKLLLLQPMEDLHNNVKDIMGDEFIKFKAFGPRADLEILKKQLQD